MVGNSGQNETKEEVLKKKEKVNFEIDIMCSKLKPKKIENWTFVMIKINFTEFQRFMLVCFDFEIKARFFLTKV